MKYSNINIGFVIMLLFVFSCKKSEQLTPTDFSESNIMVPGTIAADTFRYNFYNKYGSKILFDFDKKDYWYSMYSSAATSKDSVDYFNYVTDPVEQKTALQFLNSQWLMFYPADFKQKNMMLYLFVVDSLFDYSTNLTTSTLYKTLTFKTNSFDNMVLCGFGNSFSKKNDAARIALRNELHFAFLYHWIYLRNRDFFPSSFYQVSINKYGLTRDSTTTTFNDYFVQGLFPPYVSTGVIQKQFPGTVAVTTGALSTISSTVYQTQDQDVAQYIRFMVQNNDAFINTYANSTNPLYKKIKEKYQILLGFFTSLGIDIRSINTKDINDLGTLNTY